MDTRACQKNFKWEWQNHFRLVFFTALFTFASCLEEDRPAIFLSPRNFNPHPYQASYEQNGNLRAESRVGPVVFPPSPPDDDNDVRNNVITIGREERKLNHPIDDHPYSKVARKYRHRFPGRFRGEDNRINPRVYDALSNHAAKVLSEPPSRLGKDYTLSSLSDQKKNYAFSYKVVDHLTGDDFAHTQSQNSEATNGEYRVKLPDGRVQIVSYVADKNGYKADVKYTENDLSSQNIQIQHIPHPGRSQIPIPKTGDSYDYRYENIRGSHLQTGLPVYHHTAPLFYEGPQQSSGYTTGASVELQPKVEIYTGGAQVRGIGASYVGSTVAPYVLEEGTKVYQANVVSSTIAPDLQEYSPIYVNVLQRQNDLGYDSK